jgi:hypothetical protein
VSVYWVLGGTGLRGQTPAAHLTELAWWFQQLAFLRNAIAHVGEIDAERYAWNGVSHSQGRPTADPS